MRPGYRFPLLIIGAAAFLAYLNSFKGVFQFDDYSVIIGFSGVHSFGAWLRDLPHGIRPLLKFTYMVNWTSGSGIFGFHLLNVLIHAANSVLAFFLVVKFLRRHPIANVSGRTIAVVAALIFALHPIQTEAVTYISGRSTSLMTFFYLSSILAYIHGIDTKNGLLIFLVSPLLFIMAAMTKETAVTLPLSLLLWRLTGQDRWGALALVRSQAVHWAILLCMLILFILHPNYGNMLEHNFDIRTLKENLLSQINGISYLLSKFVMINRMNIDPDLPVLSAWTFGLAAKATLLSTAILAGLLSVRRVPWLGFGLLWVFVHLLSTNSIVPREDIANDRQLYVSLIGMSLIMGSAIVMFQAALKKGQRLVQACLVAVLVALWISTIVRNHVYRSDIALWEDTRLKSPHKARVYNNLGTAYGFAERNEEARQAYLFALKLNPDYPLAKDNLAVLLRRDKYRNGK